MMQAIVGVLAGNLASTSTLAQRGQLVLLHEIVHLQQDLSTGLGAWDHVMTRDAMHRLAFQAKWFVNRHTPFPYGDRLAHAIGELKPSNFKAQMLADLADVKERTVGRRLLKRREWWEAPGMSAALIEADVPNIPSALAEFSLRSMFETEAAGLVWSTITAAHFDEESSAWLDQHRTLWHLDDLHEDYTAPIVRMADVLSDPGEELTNAFFNKWMPLLIRLTAFLVDWASRLSSPRTTAGSIERGALQSSASVCGRTGRSAENGSYPLSLSFTSALLNSQPMEAQRILGEWTSVSYLSSGEIYGAWIDRLTPLAESDEVDAPLFEARCHAMQARLRQESSKGILGIPESGSMVQVLVDGQGLRGLMTGFLLLKSVKVMHALLTRQQHLALYEWLFEDRPFRRPWGRASVCDSVLDRCRDGLPAITDLPTQGCQIRDDLERAGYIV